MSGGGEVGRSEEADPEDADPDLHSVGGGSPSWVFLLQPATAAAMPIHDAVHDACHIGP
jgi:hypothetical protein